MSIALSMDEEGIAAKIRFASGRINEAIIKHRPIAVFALFSGGHDSLSSTYIAQDFSASAVHINTGIGVPLTRKFVHETCKTLGCELIELKAAESTNAKGQPDPQIYKTLVMRHGFPGPGVHGMMYSSLKERALRRLARMYGASARGKNPRRIMLIAGCRSQESVRRMGNVEPVQVDGRFIWVNPIHDWTKLDTSALIQHAGLKRNIIVDLIHKSGECLCGAFAKPGELAELALWPQTRPAYNQIIKLQKEAAAAGVHAVWGTRPPKEKKCKVGTLGPLCWSCDKSHDEAEAA